MFTRRDRLLGIFLFFDLVLICVSFGFMLYLKFGGIRMTPYISVVGIVMAAWSLVVIVLSGNSVFFRERIWDFITRQLREFVVLTGIICASILVLNLELYSRIMIFGTIGSFFLLRNVAHALIHLYLRRMRVKGRHLRKVLIIGAGRVGQNLYEFISENPQIGYQVTGFLDDSFNNPDLDSAMVKGGLGDLQRIISSEKVDELYIAIPLHRADKIKELSEVADFHGVRVRLIPDYYRIFGTSFEFHRFGTLPIVHVREVPLDHLGNKLLKRIFDILFSSAVLILLFPLLIVISLFIVADSPGSVFYIPKRVGHNGRVFRCLKFRSMRHNESVSNNSRSTEKDDSRVTPIGRFLRKHSLDELPQFINVLFGDMSVVGPRPHRVQLDWAMQHNVDGYMLRHYIRPGITGWAQVNGWRGPTDTEEQRTERTSHDIWYVENWSFPLDIRIIWLTVFGNSVKKNAF